MPNDNPLSRKWFPIVSAGAVFMVSSVMVMLGPILVALAADLHTTVAMAGQLATITSLIWGFAATAVGPVSDTYGRRRVLLIGLLLLSASLGASTLATTFGALFVARILTGFAAAMIPPTIYAACADQSSPAHASRALSWTMAGGLLGGALGMPITAWLANQGNWRTPFLVLAAVVAVMWLGIWLVFPRHAPKPGHGKSFLSHFRDVGRKGNAVWLLLLSNFLLQATSWGTLAYLPAYLMQTYRLPMGALSLPLLFNGLGIMSGALAGGPLATHPRRAIISVCSLGTAALLISIAFSVHLSLWGTVVLTASAGGMFVLSQPLILTLLLGLAGEARGTVTGIFALSNQIGAMCGTALGGALLTLGSYSYVGMGCLASGIVAAITMTRAMRKVA